MDRALPGNVKMIQVPCTGRIEILHLLKPFEEGADGVYVAGCQEDSCQYISGITKATQRVAGVKRILEQLDLEPDRHLVFNLQVYLLTSPASHPQLSPHLCSSLLWQTLVTLHYST